MKKIGDVFTSELHARHLKAAGFKKVRRTFCRPRDVFSELYQIQGSAWNGPEEPWTFYLNCGIHFEGLPRRNPDLDFPNAHASMRATIFTTAAEAQYDVTDANLTSVVDELAAVIEECSSYFQRRHQVLRECYEDKRYHLGFPADPELPGMRR